MARGFSNTWSSNLSAAYTAGSPIMTVRSSVGAPAVPFGIKVDSEYFLVVNVAGTKLSVVGAQEDSTAANHRSGVAVRNLVTAQDLQQLQLATQPQPRDYVRSSAARAFLATNFR